MRAVALMVAALLGCSKPAPVLVVPVQDAGTEAAEDAQPDADPGCVPWNWEQGCLPKTTARAAEPDAGVVDAGPPVLSSYSTIFDPIDGRVTNIQVAAAALAGAVIEPGSTFSFNDRVGIRSAANGYVNAPVLLQGRRTPDLGGGVCQVSSTLHAAALMGQLPIVERRAHSMVPKYIQPGYDATVAFPASCEVKGGRCEKLDLRIHNPYAEPLTIGASVEPVGDKMRLTVSLLGREPKRCDKTPSYHSEPTNKGVRRMIASEKIRNPGYVRNVQSAKPGAMVWSGLKWHCEGEPDHEVRWTSHYPPVDEVWEVGAGRPEDAGTPWGGEP